MGFQLLHHIGAELGNQAEDVLGGEGVVAGPIHRMADSHIAGKVQQAVIHIFRWQLRPHSTGWIRRKVVLFLSSLKIPFLHLVFDVLSQCVIDLLPAHQTPQGIAEGDCFFVRKTLQRQSGQISFQQLIREKRRSVVVPHHGGEVGVIFSGSAVQDILDAEICLCQHLRGSVRLVDQIVAVMHAVVFR